MRTPALLLIAALGAAPLQAQSEDALRAYFEGHSVVVLVDMPANTKGLDVYPEHDPPLDPGQVASRLGQYGVAVHAGEPITITRLKVKKNLIEFQLGGGGFSNFHDSSGSTYIPSVGKTNREKELEREVKREKDPERKRRLQRQLDDLRRDREREEARDRAVAEAANEVKRQKDQERALGMGSRFNIRFDKRVPPEALTPQAVMQALGGYVDFSGQPPEASSPVHGLRKGMSRHEVEMLLGRPARSEKRSEGQLDSTVAVYSSGSDRIEVTFVEGVVVAYRITSR